MSLWVEIIPAVFYMNEKLDCIASLQSNLLYGENDDAFKFFLKPRAGGFRVS